MTRPSLLREVITVAALLVAAGVAGLSQHRNAALWRVVLQTRMSSARAQTQDRLIGKPIDLLSLSVRDSVTQLLDGNRPLLVWIVDLDDCSGCFDGVAEWARLERLESHDLVLLLVGARTRAVNARLRALRRTLVAEARREEVFASLGGLLPNTKFLLDAERIAVLVDSRASGQECGWNFEAQVAALTGLNSARAIRTVAP